MHLLLTESSAHPGMLATAEAEREYWLSLQKAAVKAPSCGMKIKFHHFMLNEPIDLIGWSACYL